MIFRGWLHTSLIDAPGHIATVLFAAGCSFRCPYCHNPDLVLARPDLPVYTEKQLFQFLAMRLGLIDAVVISGGEPTLQPDLLPFLDRLRDWPVWVKLDTNGSHPAVLREILARQLVDYVAMDVKAPPNRYTGMVGQQADMADIEASIALLKTSPMDYEFRTTLIAGWHQQADIIEIARWITPARRYILQRFNPHATLDRDWQAFSAPSVSEVETWVDAARLYIPDVRLR